MLQSHISGPCHNCYSAWHFLTVLSGLSAASFGHGASVIWIKVDFPGLASASCLFGDITVGLRAQITAKDADGHLWLAVAHRVPVLSDWAGVASPQVWDRSLCKLAFMLQWLLDRESHNTRLKETVCESLPPLFYLAAAFKESRNQDLRPS